MTDRSSKELWRDIRDCAPFADGTERPVWRVSMAPSEAHKMVLALRMEAGADAFYDWQGGLVWLRMEAEPEADTLAQTDPAVRRRPRHADARQPGLARRRAGVRAAAGARSPRCRRG